MTNYVVSCELADGESAYAEMHKHIRKSGWDNTRLHATAWYVGAGESIEEVYDYVKLLLKKKDRVVIVSSAEIIPRRIKIAKRVIDTAWRDNL